MKRRIFSEEHEIFREAFRQFLIKEAVPHYAEWEKAGMVSREVWKKAGESGFLCPGVAEKYGGAGADFLYSVVIMESCMSKYWVAEMLKRAVDQGVQLHGGYGYSTEYDIAKAYLDARAITIYAGTSEIMLEIVSRMLPL